MLDQYIKDRDEMLIKCDVNEFRKFVHKYKHIYTKQYLLDFDLALDEVLQIALHKMIVNVTSMPKELQDKSLEWLHKHRLSPNI